jgi:hypothetical protein
METTHVHPLPVSVSGTPEEVKRRLDERLLCVGSLWFPSRAELQAWDEADMPLYIVRNRTTTLEIGPHLANMWASCFSPVLRGTLENRSDGTAISWSRGWPTVTHFVLWSWTVVLAIWLLVLLPQIASGSEHPIWLLWWSILSATRVAATALGGHYGGQTLDTHIPWLTQALTEVLVEEEDW